MSAFSYFERASVFADAAKDGRPIYALTPGELEGEDLDEGAREWVRANGFKAKSGEFLPVPGAGGVLAAALLGLGDAPKDAPFVTGSLAQRLPEGNWYLAAGDVEVHAAALGFSLGSYRFDRFKSAPETKARLCPPDGSERAELDRQTAGVFLARDLVNLPTNHMGPEALEDAFRRLGAHYGANVSVTSGDALLDENFPMIHAVGRAGAEAPRLLDMRWGRTGAPKVTLVGKGVCFDTGGLDIKPPSSMLLMKKDMGGAANVMGLALMVMDAGLDVDLRVLVPAVENAIAGNAFRPSDILTSRKGLTVQIDNTDAEGRLVLADALALACEETPDLLIDMATLTGAARVALGPDVAPFYTHDTALAGALSAASEAEHDPLWRMPLVAAYDDMLTTKVADITNAPSGGFAGSITAALFLNRFVEPGTRWAHFDIYGWNPKAKPHAPVGGEAQGIRALYRVLRERYGEA
ncbi:leucyl aminopeptidase family protein [Pararhizobium mangrovi]|uniref:Leucyl aminopeptidase family protein n=1 Tax=Pararhizobium mangrovi TaxID=2590452 RepID=A0A506UG72_9HYPH|nr:M17 family metallopeptidase [Pararhizobium mangrovi]TPW32676.1 leucyl aminopeptidase family protein [Pararhizobium mangrovi]